MSNASSHIFRLQSVVDGSGIYSDMNHINHILYTFKNTPSPNEDRDIARKWNILDDADKFYWFFGFKSIEDLVRWIPSHKYLKLLNELGFKLFKFEVKSDECFLGENQAIFNSENVIRCDEIDNWLFQIPKSNYDTIYDISEDIIHGSPNITEACQALADSTNDRIKKSGYQYSILKNKRNIIVSSNRLRRILT